jgi:hypothetical protein
VDVGEPDDPVLIDDERRRIRELPASGAEDGADVFARQPLLLAILLGGREPDAELVDER